MLNVVLFDRIEILYSCGNTKKGFIENHYFGRGGFGNIDLIIENKDIFNFMKLDRFLREYGICRDASFPIVFGNPIYSFCVLSYICIINFQIKP